jgi:hypothetical protein
MAVIGFSGRKMQIWISRCGMSCGYVLGLLEMMDEKKEKRPKSSGGDD